ncbi:MAG: CHAD domain-containing protein [Methanomassiliicoccales archaeon]|nr:MAG: CHAD domain-containing protein [Methanomassiliicoccales archaeon]
MVMPESGYLRFAALTIQRQMDDLERELRGASKDADIEFVHRSRVASRRLRASLGTFYDCLPKDKRKVWMRTVKGVTRSLGEARDLDVQIEFLMSYISKKEDDASLHRLLASLCKKRNLAQASVDRSVKELIEEGALRSLKDWCDDSLSYVDDLRAIKRKALIGAMAGIDDLFEFDRYVQDPSAVIEHHEMRIATKKLRYTLEIFSGVFEGGLRPYIKKLKELQDVLGEMHDCDVWTSMLARIKGGGAASLKADREARRSELYDDFTKMWAEIKEGTIPRLEAAVRDGGSVAKVPMSDGPVAIISDIHGNLPALLAVLKDADEAGAVAVINAGDSVGPAPFNPEVIAELTGRGAISVIGNFDREMLAFKEGGSESKKVPRSKEVIIKKIVRQLGRAECDWLLSLPERVLIDVGGKNVLVVHASPTSREEKVMPSTSKDRLKELAVAAKADVIITGHSHIPLDVEEAEARFINPGSVGRQVDGDPRASYTIWYPKEGVVKMRRTAYPLHELIDRFKELRWSSKECLAYASGGREKGTRAKGDVDPVRALSAAESLAMEHGHLDAHTLHVRDLSLKLFDALSRDLDLAPSDRVLLECAAIVHDIGWAWGGKGHNRSSFDLVMMSSAFDLPLVQKIIVASICRYHRGKGPKRSHGNLDLLDREDRAKVVRLASLLRIADGLDHDHGKKAEISSVKIVKGELAIELVDPSVCEENIKAALGKSNLFSELTGMKVRIG